MSDLEIYRCAQAALPGAYVSKGGFIPSEDGIFNQKPAAEN